MLLSYLQDESLVMLVMSQMPRLEDLEVSGNGNVTDKGVVYLRKIHTLKRLKFEDLPEVEDPELVIKRISDKLPHCEVIWPPYTAKEGEGQEEGNTKEEDGGGGARGDKS